MEGWRKGGREEGRKGGREEGQGNILRRREEGGEEEEEGRVGGGGGLGGTYDLFKARGNTCEQLHTFGLGRRGREGVREGGREEVSVAKGREVGKQGDMLR